MEMPSQVNDLASVARLYLNKPWIVELQGKVQHYDWGDFDFIPGLLGLENPRREPFAELWLGAHPDLPAAALVENVAVPLDLLLRHAPKPLLGPATAAKYDGDLPFLFKILAARQPLSIQVHPNKDQAIAGFERENRLGIPLSSPQRNFRDRNHKPELFCALTPFYALKGFRPLEEIDQILKSIPEWRDLRSYFHATDAGLRSFYSHLMTMPQTAVNGYLQPMLERLAKEAPFPRTSREYWLLESDALYSKENHKDRGLFSLFLLNFLCLQPGQAIYQRAGELHSYLSGAGIEVMANSNNVVRGGLTKKHVDVAALLEIVEFRPGKPEIFRGEQLQAPFEDYLAPADEFILRKLHMTSGQVWEIRDQPLHLAIVIDGQITVECDSSSRTLPKGKTYLAPYHCCYRVRADSDSLIYFGGCRQ